MSGALSKERMSLQVKPKLLILDEMGYLSLDPFAATCLSQVGQRALREGLHHPDLEQELRRLGLDLRRQSPRPSSRLLHHSTTINIEGESYRLKGKKRPESSPPKPPTRKEPDQPESAWEYAAPGFVLRRTLPA